jgi:CubicO group peptidase (beta-lactamase class C family)
MLVLDPLRAVRLPHSRPFLWLARLAGLVLLTSLVAATDAPLPSPTAGDPVITDLLQPIRQKHDLPALAALVLTSERVVASGTVGVRKRGTDTPAGLADCWHLGSDTKAMTAALLARLVDRQQIRWNSTLPEIFPELAANADPAWTNLTLLHLLAHRAGLPANLDLSRYRGSDAPAERLRAVQQTLAKPPAKASGSNYLYSNLGYILAGAAAERVTGKSWETALRDELFTPLGMTNAGFGGLGTSGLVDQPWPHRASGQPMPANGPNVDNPPVMGPAGRVHAPLSAWAKFIQDQLRGARGQPALLSPQSYRTLRTPPFGGDYALGWLVMERPWAGGVALHHAGDNTMNHANVWLAPQRDFAILVCANQGGERAARACDEAVAALVQWRAHTSASPPPR